MQETTNNEQEQYGSETIGIAVEDLVQHSETMLISVVWKDARKSDAIGNNGSCVSGLYWTQHVRAACSSVSMYE